MRPLIASMTDSDVAVRLDAPAALQQWRRIRSRLCFVHRFWRLRLRQEGFGRNLLLGLLDIFRLVSMVPIGLLARLPYIYRGISKVITYI